MSFKWTSGQSKLNCFVLCTCIKSWNRQSFWGKFSKELFISFSFAPLLFYFHDLKFPITDFVQIRPMNSIVWSRRPLLRALKMKVIVHLVQWNKNCCSFTKESINIPILMKSNKSHLLCLTHFTLDIWNEFFSGLCLGWLTRKPNHARWNQRTFKEPSSVNTRSRKESWCIPWASDYKWAIT